MGVFDIPLVVNCGEDGVDKDKSSNDLNVQADAFVVAGGELISTPLASHSDYSKQIGRL